MWLRVVRALVGLQVAVAVQADLEQEPDLWYPLIPLTQLRLVAAVQVERKDWAPALKAETQGWLGIIQSLEMRRLQ